MVWYYRAGFWYGNKDCLRPWCQNSRFLFGMLLNLMMVGEGWSFILYSCCECPRLFCIDLYC